jgi:hypothetical protein
MLNRCRICGSSEYLIPGEYSDHAEPVCKRCAFWYACQCGRCGKIYLSPIRAELRVGGADEMPHSDGLLSLPCAECVSGEWWSENAN